MTAQRPTEKAERPKSKGQSRTDKAQSRKCGGSSADRGQALVGRLTRRVIPSLLVLGLMLTMPAAAYGSDVKYDQLLRGQISDLKEKRKEVRQQQDDIQRRLDWDDRARGYAYLLSTNNLAPLRAQMDPVDVYRRMPGPDQAAMKDQICLALTQEEMVARGLDPEDPNNQAVFQQIYAHTAASLDMEQFIKDHPDVILTDQVVRAYWNAMVSRIGILSEIDRQDYVQTKNSMVVQVDSQIRLLQSQGLLLNNQAQLRNAQVYIQSRQAQRDYTSTVLEKNLAEQRLANSLASEIDQETLREEVDYLQRKAELQQQLWQLTHAYSQKVGVPAQFGKPDSGLTDDETIAQAKTNRFEIVQAKEEKAVASARSVPTEIDLADAHLLKAQKDLELEICQSSLDLAKVKVQQTQVASAIQALDAQIQWLENRPADQSPLAINTLKQQRDQYRLDQEALADQEQLILFWRQLQMEIGPQYRGIKQ